jgi:hypothetical protein
MDHMVDNNDDKITQNIDDLYLYDKPFIPSKTEKIA